VVVRRKRRKVLVSVKISEETYQLLRKFRAWRELSTGARISLDACIRELCEEFLKVVTIPWEEVEAIEKLRHRAVPPGTSQTPEPRT